MFDKKMLIWEINPFIGQNLTRIEERILELIITGKCDKKKDRLSAPLFGPTN